MTADEVLSRLDALEDEFEARYVGERLIGYLAGAHPVAVSQALDAVERGLRRHAAAAAAESPAAVA